MKRWLRPRPRGSVTATPFAVPCRCGEVVRGLRKTRHMAVRCPACRAAVFVLGASPLPPPPGSPPLPPPSPASTWQRPLLVGGVTFVVVVLLAVAAMSLFPPLSFKEDPKPALEDGPVAKYDAGRRALAEEKLQAAQRLLRDAQAATGAFPQALPPADRRRLDQLLRQTDLLVDLSHDSLNEVLSLADGLNDEDWQGQFEKRFRDRAIVFDDIVRREPDGSHRLTTFEVRAPGGPARLDLDGLKVLRNVPLGQPQRLLFGARLSEIQREAGGRWVVRFDPDSGVLLTDEDVAAACCPAPLGDDLKALVRQQAEWVAR